MSSVLSLPLTPPFSLYNFHKPCTLSAYNFSPHPPSSLSFVKFRIRASSSSDFGQEESRWLREEQRWLREEQRWLREEQRWFRDRESLLRQISDLKLQIQSLDYQISGSGQGGASTSEAFANIAALVQALKEKNRIAESGTSAIPMVLEETEDKEVVVEETEDKKAVVEETEDKEVVVEEVVRIREKEEQQKMKRKKRRTLRNGAEGDEVQQMQEALQKLGFYSGEEDMEFSSFSSGTEQAVMTWQSSLGVPEDGVMTAELLERLYMGELSEGAGTNLSAIEEESPVILQKEGANGAVLTSITEPEQKVVVEDGVREVGVPEHRVFLLGENRWEDSSRLGGGTKHSGNTSGTECLTCHGKGRIMCIECDGTGEPNIEPQFIEWVDEAMKCPYCDNGYAICDVCDGKAIV